MLALRKQKEAAAAAAAAAAAGGGGAPAMSVFGAGDDGKVNVGAAKRKESSGQLRMQKDVAEFEQYDFLQVVWPNDKDVMRCVLKCRPKGGYWSGACVDFQMDFSHEDYPIKPPKVTCISRVYHPNISLEGAVCLSMLKERHTDVNGIDDGWKPVHTLTTIAMGVLSLFMEPNPDDPLHIHAAREMRENNEQFARNVKQSLQGGALQLNVFNKEGVAVSQRVDFPNLLGGGGGGGGGGLRR